jgi:Ni/Fe-hydrogenase subunit HybB-like protein
MAWDPNSAAIPMKKPVVIVFTLLIAIGLAAFIFGLTGKHPERAWQAYLINFLLWSGVAQGGLLFSTVMHTTKARWSRPLSGLSESFGAFFPISFGLFLILFLGKNHLFPWLHHDLHGKEVWLNLPFLFSRDVLGLLILYGIGFAYLYHALALKLKPAKKGAASPGRFRQWFAIRPSDAEPFQKRMTVFAILYIMAFAVVLSLIGYDLVMSMDPHWYSTLFGAYHFVKAFYIGLGALIILASISYMRQGNRSGLKPAHFHDLGKLFFAFCLVWADFFYCQFVVIWYGNIPEETGYVIERTMIAPWNVLAWTVFIVSFVIPFFILLNKNIKTKPVAMMVISGLVIIGIWLEHLLLLGPALNKAAHALPLGFSDLLITLGFMGLMAFAVTFFINLFPELGRPDPDPSDTRNP